MNWRAGGHRLVRAIAAIYLIVSLLIVGAIYMEYGRQFTVAHEFQLTARDKAFSVWAYDAEDAEHRLARALEANPTLTNPNPYDKFSATVIGEPLPPKSTLDNAAGASNAAVAAFVMAIGFFVLWALYRTARWIILGFAEPKARPNK